MSANRISRREALRLGSMAMGAVAGALIFSGGVEAERPIRWRPPTTDAASVANVRRSRQVLQPPAPVTPSASATPGILPTQTVYRALDTDFGNVGLQPQSWFDAAKKAGYDGFITTLHTNWGAQPAPWPTSYIALERALAAGMWIGAYGRPVHLWREALSPLPAELREQLKFYALDVEVEPQAQHPLRRAYVDGVANEFGVRPIIYTGWGMWGDVMGYGSDGFADVPLWDFSGDRMDWPSNLGEPELVPFGGWNVEQNLRTGWQVQMQTPALLNGVYVDRDLFSRDFIDAV